MKLEKGERKFLKIAAVGITVLILTFLWIGGVFEKIYYAIHPSVFNDSYQAVFLTNNQVYFCKLKDFSKEYVLCQDVYYLKNELRSNQVSENELEHDTQLTLLRLGDEIHQPESEIKIRREHIMFVEDIKEEAEILEAIEEFEKDN